MLRRTLPLLVATTVALACAACGAMRTTQFSNPNFDFGFVEKVAVLPMDNLSTDAQAGVRSTRLMVTELLASGAVDVVEMGEVTAAMHRLSVAPGVPSTEQVVALGEALQVQALLVGTVTQSEVVRSGNVTMPVVTLDVHMIEIETGTPVWAATHSERGAGAGAVILGTGAEPLSETTRRCARHVVGRLVR